MNEIKGYIEYNDTLKLYSKRSLALVGWCTIAAFFLIIVLVCLFVMPPTGVIPLILWVLYMRKVVVKKWKNCSATWKRIKQYDKINGSSMVLTKPTTYCFVSPVSTNNTMNAVVSVLKKVGSINEIDRHNNCIEGKIRISSKKQFPVVFYVGNYNGACNVRALFKRRANDDWWDLFLNELMNQFPSIDFGVTPAKAHVKIAGVLDLQGDVEQHSYSVTKNHASLGKFLVGGALFGDVGAVVGGLSGKSNTTTKSYTVYSDQLLVRIIYNNGRLWEGRVYKNQPLYQQILVNLNNN